MRLSILLVLLLTFAACRTEAPEPSPAPVAPYLIYIGTSSGDPANGIHALRFDPETGALSRLDRLTPILNPSFLARSRDGQFLYAVSESDAMGSVHAYRVDAATGELTFLNQQATGGNGPAYVSMDQTGRWVLVANYGGGSVALLPVEEDGRLGAAADVAQHTGSGPNRERQEGPHAHYVHVSPDNRYAYAVDLGIDRVRVYPLDLASGSFQAAAAREVATIPGAGPRHLDFHPGGRYAYLINELNGTVTAYTYDPETGNLTPINTVSTLPEDFSGTNTSADIHVHPSGRWLYASNRGDFDSIVVFSIDEATGRLSPAGQQREGIHWPRNFAIDPTGRFLFVANQHGNDIRVFTIDEATGQLAPTDQRAEVTAPTNITLMAQAR